VEKLIRGVDTFQNRYFNQHEDLFLRLTKGQTPEALFITCSDSRISPNLLTQTEPGELFILRNAGNIIPAHGSLNNGEAATVEFAVTGLGIKDIIVCGHTHCGAMAALLNPDHLSEMPAMREWLKHAEATRLIVKDHYGHLPEEAQMLAAIEENVLVQIEHLRTLPAVASALVSGSLRLHGWVYLIEKGEVLAYDGKEQAFLPLKLSEGSAIQRPLRRTQQQPE